MADATLPSIFLITLLMAIGLVFFVRGSFRDRTTRARYRSEREPGPLVADLQRYFEGRAYRLETSDAEARTARFVGLVAPSVFLCGFVTLMAASGLLCLGLVLDMAVPALGSVGLALVAGAPVAGRLYWQRARREEAVELVFEPADQGSQLKVTAHRDELLAMEAQLPLVLQESD